MTTSPRPLTVVRTNRLMRSSSARSEPKSVPHSPSESTGSQRGAALPVVVLGMVFMLLISVLLVGLADRASDRSRAQAAADAAALAGAVDGREGAAALAEANSGQLMEFESDQVGVSVVVEVDGHRAQARAERRLSPHPRG